MELYFRCIFPVYVTRRVTVSVPPCSGGASTTSTTDSTTLSQVCQHGSKWPWLKYSPYIKKTFQKTCTALMVLISIIQLIDLLFQLLPLPPLKGGYSTPSFLIYWFIEVWIWNRSVTILRETPITSYFVYWLQEYLLWMSKESSIVNSLICRSAAPPTLREENSCNNLLFIWLICRILYLERGGVSLLEGELL